MSMFLLRLIMVLGQNPVVIGSGNGSQVFVALARMAKLLHLSGLSDRSGFHAIEHHRRDEEEVMCESLPGGLLRNGIGDNSYFIWPERRIPYLIDESFNVSAQANIKEAITDFNRIFADCIQWVKRTTEPVYVEFLNGGSCYSKIGRAYWPLPLPQSIALGQCSHLVGHIKHEMMHTLGFYHEHSRSDRDEFVHIRWKNIKPDKADQFETYRWTTAYGEKYDYDSIMHYTANAFSKHNNPFLMTIVPKFGKAEELGRRVNYSTTDIIKIKKMYKCGAFLDWENECSSDSQCGFHEFCDSYLINGQCRTKLPDGSLCYRSGHCIHECYAGVCTSCKADSDCNSNQYCVY
eukprot:maker-scaffold1884_size25683-snap-gene-0.4 protein:Tk09611 transcript:maker-scaffold1884_size25683-snap-gene-0.4-mRNA-1 annotation:"hypothetical protein BRAFLDRAFT_245310"